MAKTSQTDILVAGTGPAGMIAALAFAGQGRQITLVGPEPSKDDERTTALMMPAIRFLQALQAIPDLLEGSVPLRTMRIADATKRLVRSPFVTFNATEIGEDAFGRNFVNRAMARHLVEGINGNSSICWKKTLISEWKTEPQQVSVDLDHGERICSRLAVAADGHVSPARTAIGIKTHRRSYPQTAFVTVFEHSLEHEYSSTEFHTETGPFTQVPLPGKRSSLVWVVNPQTADTLMAMDDVSLSTAIEERMESILGKVTVGKGRQIYPLSVLIPATFARKRVALVGEAAHVFPPIGAQGLNLGIRDIADLVNVTKHGGDPGSDVVLGRYNRKRRPDILARTGSVHLLNTSLLSDMLPAQIARRVGLSALDAFAPLRGFFMREGLQPGSGFRHLKSAVREQIRR